MFSSYKIHFIERQKSNKGSIQSIIHTPRSQMSAIVLRVTKITCFKRRSEDSYVNIAPIDWENMKHVSNSSKKMK